MYSIVNAALWMSVERSVIRIELGTVETRLDVQRRTGTDASQHYFGPVLFCPALPCHNASSLRGAGQAVYDRSHASGTRGTLGNCLGRQF